MVNLTEVHKGQGSVSIFERMRWYFTPDVFLADNLADYCEHRSRVQPKLPSYILGGGKRIFVILHHVGIQQAPSLSTIPLGIDPQEFYLMSDASGCIVTLWPGIGNPVYTSHTRADSIPGIVEGERVLVQRVLLLYLMDEGVGPLSIVVHVTHGAEPRRPKKVRERESVLDRILAGLAEPTPI